MSDADSDDYDYDDDEYIDDIPFNEAVRQSRVVMSMQLAIPQLTDIHRRT